jgi:hypothetical protein
MEVDRNPPVVFDRDGGREISNTFDIGGLDTAIPVFGIFSFAVLSGHVLPLTFFLKIQNKIILTSFFKNFHLFEVCKLPAGAPLVRAQSWRDQPHACGLKLYN